MGCWRDLLTKIEVWSLAAPQKRKIRQKCMGILEFDRFLSYYYYHYYYYIIVIIIIIIYPYFFFVTSNSEGLDFFWISENHMKSQQVNCPSLSRPCLKAGSRGCWTRSHDEATNDIFMTLKGCFHIPYHRFLFEKTTKNGEILGGEIVTNSQTPSGMVVPVKTALFTMVNTDPKCFWLTNFLETLLVQAGCWVFLALDAGSTDPPTKTDVVT